MTYDLLLPTPSVKTTANTIKVIRYMLSNHRVKQGTIAKHIGISQKYVSLITDDLASVGWISKTYQKTHNEIVINKHRIGDMLNFIRVSQFRQKALIGRPHHAIVYGFFDIKPNFDLIPFEFVSLHKKNKGNEIMFDTEYGHITIYRNSTTIKFTIIDLIVIMDEKGVDYFADYLEANLIVRLKAMVKFLSNKNMFGKVKINSLKLLDETHIGIVTRKNLAKDLNIDKELESIGLECDESIRDFNEWESKKDWNTVVKRAEEGLRKFFNTKNKK